MTQYLIAIRHDFGNRAARAGKAAEVREVLAHLDGITYVGNKGAPTIIIDTTPDILASVQKQMGAGIWIEERKAPGASGLFPSNPSPSV